MENEYKKVIEAHAGKTIVKASNNNYDDTELLRDKVFVEAKDIIGQT